MKDDRRVRHLGRRLHPISAGARWHIDERDHPTFLCSSFSYVKGSGSHCYIINLGCTGDDEPRGGEITYIHPAISQVTTNQSRGGRISHRIGPGSCRRSCDAPPTSSCLMPLRLTSSGFGAVGRGCGCRREGGSSATRGGEEERIEIIPRSHHGGDGICAVTVEVGAGHQREKPI